jgi:hypothetical protein
MINSRYLQTYLLIIIKGDRVMVFNATFNNISVIWWQLVLLAEETGILGEKHY